MSVLTDRIREVLDANPSRDPREVAQMVADDAPSNELRGLLAVAAVDRVRAVLSGERLSAVRAVAGEGSFRSVKVSQRRDWWAAFLGSSYHVDGVWMRAAVMSPEDWDWVAGERRAVAARNLAEADREEKIAALLRERGVACVSELDEATVAAALGGAR